MTCKWEGNPHHDQWWNWLKPIAAEGCQQLVVVPWEVHIIWRSIQVTRPWEVKQQPQFEQHQRSPSNCSLWVMWMIGPSIRSYYTYSQSDLGPLVAMWAGCGPQDQHAHIQLSRFYLGSILDITCMTSRTRLLPLFSVQHWKTGSVLGMRLFLTLISGNQMHSGVHLYVYLSQLISSFWDTEKNNYILKFSLPLH